MYTHFSTTHVLLHKFLEFSHTRLKASLWILSPTTNPEEYPERVERFTIKDLHSVFCIYHKVWEVRIEFRYAFRLAYLEGQVFFALEFPYWNAIVWRVFAKLE